MSNPVTFSLHIFSVTCMNRVILVRTASISRLASSAIPVHLVSMGNTQRAFGHRSGIIYSAGKHVSILMSAIQ